MSAIKVYQPTNPRLIDLSLEQLLAELGRYAFVTIFNSDNDDTWSARATMRIKTKGAEFTVQSGYKHASTKSALMALLELVQNAVTELGDKK